MIMVIIEKYLLALKSLKKSYAIDKNNNEVRENIVQFVKNCNFFNMILLINIVFLCIYINICIY